MNVEDAIKNRRSIRRYLDKEVDLKIIAKILDLARYAPSSGNLQNWQIIIVTDENKRRELAIASLKQMWMVSAPVHLVICNNKTDPKRFYGERGELYSIQNCAALAENILLLATSYDLASCWVGAFDKEAVSRIIKTPDNITPGIIITLGYSNEKTYAPTRISIEKITSFNEFDIRETGTSLFPLEKHKTVLKKKSNNIIKKLKEKFLS